MRAVPVKSYNLSRLQYWLEYELAGSLLLVMSYFFSITYYLVLFAAFAFIPLLVRVLVEQRRYGWLISFAVFVVIPPLMLYFLPDTGYWSGMAIYLGLVSFYLYCVLLRVTIPSWLD